MIIIGIDPGLAGALAYIRIRGGREVVVVIDTPTVRVRGTVRRDYDLSAIGAIMRALAREGAVRAAIEHVHAMPGQGVTSMFRMGYGRGWEWALAALDIPYVRVSPQRWQRAMLGPDRGKDAARRRARALYPGIAELFARRKDHGRADAVLLATYAREYLGEITGAE